ncbi:MAG: hypothetical protein WAU39_02145 [Polyangiales bacterium]
MRDKPLSTMFFVAALWNFAAALPGLISYEWQFKLLFGDEAYTGDFHQALLFRSFALSVLLFGIGYYLVSRDISQNRGIVWLGAVGKILVFVFFTVAFLGEQVTTLAWTVSIGDLLWALAFLWFLHRTKDQVRVSNLVG